MLKFEFDNDTHIAQSEVSGKPIDIMAEMMMSISAMYTILNEKNEILGEIFKRACQDGVPFIVAKADKVIDVPKSRENEIDDLINNILRSCGKEYGDDCQCE